MSSVIKYVTLENLKYYHELQMKSIKALIELYHEGTTNCPNCGAAIHGEECAYCGTNFMKWYEI